MMLSKASDTRFRVYRDLPCCVLPCVHGMTTAYGQMVVIAWDTTASEAKMMLQAMQPQAIKTVRNGRHAAEEMVAVKQGLL